jgi:hypothetical protein
MIRDLGGQRVWLTCISAHRPDNVPKMRELIGEATWYVPESDVPEYRAQGADAVPDGGSLVAARNKALTDAFNLNVTCIQMSDDLKNIKRWSGEEGVKPIEIPVLEALGDLIGRLHATDLRLGGVAPTNNGFFTSKSTGGSNLFILGDLIAVRPCGLRFDPNLRLKEDFDFTAAHYQTFGGALRCDDLLPTFAHYTNKGGAVAYRSDTVESETIAYLMRKWPGWIVPNPRRKNEVLMRMPRRERVIL